jgi:adenylylsulfate kinase-like enzyme
MGTNLASAVIAGAMRHALSSHMKLIFLHGAPATGKLTIAKALLRAIPGRLFDNHAAIDLAETVFDFGAPGFWALVQTVRRAVLDAAAAQGCPAPGHHLLLCRAGRSDGLHAIRILRRHEGEVLPVFLHCSRAEMIRRVTHAERAARGKIGTAKGLESFLHQYDLVPVPRADCLVLDSEAKSADATAQDIIRHFGLAAGS